MVGPIPDSAKRRFSPVLEFGAVRRPLDVTAQIEPRRKAAEIVAVPNRPSQYRAKAQEARERAASETDDSTRAKLLNDADLWDRMAAFEENTPSQNFQSYYPKK